MNDPQLGPSLRDLAARVAAVEPPAGLEAAVMAEFDRAHRRRRTVRATRALAMCGAMAASLVAGALLLRPEPKAAAPAESQAFFPIPYTPPLEPYERVMVVQEQVPVAELVAAGFRVPTSDPGGSVRADVMVGQDGRPRAIRPVVFTVSDRSSQ
jgi:hypothetical protein